ncbi:hypothetical protein Fot_28617 [Forsythia ovata]|uniref:Uncharacterized protein n=1 Tax=Forsythia ovata TaxID=205694 RepID=A0ABD1TPJ1_9LAMI
MLIYSLFPRGEKRDLGMPPLHYGEPDFLLPGCLALPDEGTGLIGDGEGGTTGVTSGAERTKEGPLAVISGVCPAATPGLDAAEGTGRGKETSSTTPPRLILNFETVEK